MTRRLPYPLPRSAPLVLASLLVCAGIGSAWGPAQAKDDQDQARQALERGEIHPLEDVLKAARAAVPGDVVKLDLKRDDGRWLYKLKILTPEGRRRELKVDAGSLKVVDDDDDDD